jgi:hypothetical protein
MPGWYLLFILLPAENITEVEAVILQKIDAKESLILPQAVIVTLTYLPLEFWLQKKSKLSILLSRYIQVSSHVSG